MINEFTRLGQLIFDLNSGKVFDLSDEDNFTFLDEEYRRILLAMGAAWDRKEMGWNYYLEFHMAEGERLLQKLRVTKDNHDLLTADQFEQERVIRAYKMLFHLFTELIKRIDMLLYGKGINLSDFNVN
jgi:hypothetical protein